MRPVSIPGYVTQILGYTEQQQVAEAHKAYSSADHSHPLVSVVIPAYNEEEHILRPLLSISRNVSKFSFEIIVVNNNSTDRTEELIRATGITCINESKKGVTAARTAGLMAAKGKYIINADGDSIYPPCWIDELITPLEEGDNICVAYGRFAFLPDPKTGRFSYFIYENIADLLRLYKRKAKDEAMNVYGCSSAFRKEECLQVDGYEHPPGTGEDGYLALKLRNKGFGKLHYVHTMRALVWTIDRHLQQDGGLWKALFMRIKGSVFGSDPEKYHTKG